LVLALAGRTTAGKTTIATELSKQLGWPRAAFGDFVRNEAVAAGLDVEREMLQALGAELIEQLGWTEFCLRVLRHAGLSASSVPCIVEGIRHTEALSTLVAIFAPTPVRLVYITLTDGERNKRLAFEDVSASRGKRWEQHSTEREVAMLADRAALVLPSDADAVPNIRAWVCRGGGHT